MVIFQLIQRRSFKTIKSINDEKTNQALLGRLKKVSIVDGKTMKRKPGLDTFVDKNEQIRKLTLRNLDKLITTHARDPLVWNSSVLGRVYHVPEHYCQQLIYYVQPFTEAARITEAGMETLIETQTVIDIERFKKDCNYLAEFKKFKFIASNRQEVKHLDCL